MGSDVVDVIRITKALFVITVAYFISVTVTGFSLFWYIWFQAYLAPDKMFRTIITVNSSGEADLELMIFIGWIMALIVISWTARDYIRSQTA